MNSEDARDVLYTLLSSGIFNRSSRSLNLVGFLDSNNKLDLWFLEVAVRGMNKIFQELSTITGKHYRVSFHGKDEYKYQRGITEDQFEEEFLFITNFSNSVSLEDL